MGHMTRVVLTSLACLAGACSLVVDGALDGKEGGSACTGADDGTSCTIEGMSGAAICRSQVCTLSTCGDGLVDGASGEQCDDGNETSGDGCEPGTCEFSCESDDECDNESVCDGTETCNVATHICAPGTDAPDETACSQEDGTDGGCRSGACRALGCGNGLPDDGEECDDGNDVSNDGCEPDCTVTCNNDEDCVPLDISVCDGVDTCDLDTNTCAGTDVLDCDDGDDCTEDSCDPIEGCINDPMPFDMDEDGHFVLSCGGDDCDDTDPEIYTGAEELCDDKDNNCDGAVDEVAPFWYLDCDEDGYAADTSGLQQQCDEPPAAGGCGWTSRRPDGPDSTDCRDDNALVFPGQTSYQTTAIAGAPSSVNYDYNCDMVESAQYPVRPAFGVIECRINFGTCFGSTYWDESSAPACGSTRTLSYCLSLGRSCFRVSREAQAACR